MVAVLKCCTRGELGEVKTRKQIRPLLPFDSGVLPFALLFRLLPFAFCLLIFDLIFLPSPALAQSSPGQPYATLNHAAVTYNGPDRDASRDLAGPEIRIGLLASFSGAHQSDGEALRHAAEMAIEEQGNPLLPSKGRLVLVTRDDAGQWGQASTQIVHLLFDDRAVAVITSTDGTSAHLAEQVANKIGVPVLTLASDTTTTEINLPWIFRLGPSDAAQARTFARDIYVTRKLQSVVLLAQDDHDSRVGAEEFAKAARAMGAPAPQQVALRPGVPLPLGGWEGAQAMVLWSDAALAHSLLPVLRQSLPNAPIYLCRKAAETSSAEANKDAGVWTAEAVDLRSASHQTFARRYRERYGVEPGIEAAQAYDAVRLLATSLRQSGPNRARLRDALASVSNFAGISGNISFDHAGNDTAAVTLRELK